MSTSYGLRETSTPQASAHTGSRRWAMQHLLRGSEAWLSPRFVYGQRFWRRALYHQVDVGRRNGTERRVMGAVMVWFAMGSTDGRPPKSSFGMRNSSMKSEADLLKKPLTRSVLRNTPSGGMTLMKLCARSVPFSHWRTTTDC